MTMSKMKLHLYVALVALGGGVLFVRVLQLDGLSDAWTDPAFWLLAAGVLVGEFVHIKVPHREETVTISVGDPFTLSLLFAFGLAPALVAKIVATVLDDARRRQVWWKVAFNIGQFSLSLLAGHAVFRLSGFEILPHRAIDLDVILMALASAFAYFLLNLSMVTAAVALAVGDRIIQTLFNNLSQTGVVQQIALIGFTPVVTAAVHDSTVLFPLLLIPIIVVYHSGMLSQKHVELANQLQELQEATRMSYGRSRMQRSVHELLERVCAMFDAQIASITLFNQDPDGLPLMTKIDLDKAIFEYMTPTGLDPTEGVWARSVSEDKAVIVPSPIENPRLKAHYDRQGIDDLMVAPMHDDDAVTGIIMVANRRGQDRSFTGEHLRLFEMLVNHVSISLRNARLVTELETSLEHLTEMNQLKDDFVASVSHELRTPLTSIRGYVSTLLRPDANFEPDDVQSFLETIDRQGRRLHRLIEDLLVVSRIESQSDETYILPVKLDTMINEVADELRSKLEGRDLELSLGENLPAVETDAGKVHQIVTNLIDNAIKYSPEGAPVRVEAKREGSGVSMTVRDFGFGIPEDKQDEIFERFYQVDQSTTRSVGGAGLGLYICRKLADAIGGRVWLQRSDETGSEFSLWLPDAVPATPSAVDLETEFRRLTDLS